VKKPSSNQGGEYGPAKGKDEPEAIAFPANS
jgi:hypothetical protein